MYTIIVVIAGRSINCTFDNFDAAHIVAIAIADTYGINVDIYSGMNIVRTVQYFQ